MERIREGWALKHPGAWLDQWKSDKGLFFENSNPGVAKAVGVLNRRTLTAACLACQSGDKDSFEALREATRYGIEYGPFGNVIQREETHLDGLIPQVFWRLLNQRPESLWNLNAWLPWDEDVLLSEVRSDVFRNSDSGEYIDVEKKTLSAKEWLHALCQISPGAEKFGRGYGFVSDVKSIPLATVVSQMHNFRKVVGSDAKLGRAIRKLSSTAEKPKTEQGQWGLLLMLGVNWAHEEAVQLSVCQAFNFPLTLRGMREWIEKNTKDHDLRPRLVSMEDFWLNKALTVAVNHGRLDFSEEEKEPRFVSSFKGEDKARRVERLVAECEAKTDRLRLAARHLVGKRPEQKEKIAL